MGIEIGEHSPTKQSPEIDKWSARFVRDGTGYDGFRWNEAGEWTVRLIGMVWSGTEERYTDKIWVAGGQKKGEKN